ncbi:MAG TPA: hypothetical protein PK033_13895 [Acetivibrio sp.]|nr:hypothetical protein [Acetivibrio sp.]
MKLSDLRDLLLTIEVPVFHYHASKQPDKYIVWAEDTEGTSISANNKKINQSIQGTIDYFTKTEFDPNVDKIQETLNSAEISWRLNSIQYEEDTGYIHYEWVFEVI